MPRTIAGGVGDGPDSSGLRVPRIAREEPLGELDELRVVVPRGVDIDAQRERLGSELTARVIEIVTIQLVERERRVAGIQRGSRGVERRELGEERRGV